MFDMNNKKLVELISIESHIVCEHIFGSPESENIPYIENIFGKKDSEKIDPIKQSELSRYALITKVFKKLKNNDDPIYTTVSEHMPGIKVINKDSIGRTIERMEAEHPGSKLSSMYAMYNSLLIKDARGESTAQDKCLLIDLDTVINGYSIIPRQILVVWYSWAVENIHSSKYCEISLESMGFAHREFKNYADVAAAIRGNSALYTKALELVNSTDTADTIINILEPVFDLLFVPDTTESSAKPATQSDFLDSVIDRLAEEHQDDDNESEEPDPYAEFTGKSGKRYTEDEIQVFLKKLETTPNKLVWLRKDPKTTKFLSDYILHLLKDLGLAVPAISKITFTSQASVRYKIDQAAGVPTKYYNTKKESSTYRKSKESKAATVSTPDPTHAPISAKDTGSVDKEDIAKPSSAAESAVNMIFASGSSKVKQEKPIEQTRVSTGGIQFKDCIATTSSGIGLLEFYYHKILSHPNSTPQAKDWARRKLDTVNRMHSLLLDLGSN